MDNQKALLIKLLEEKKERERYNKFYYVYPDFDNNNFSASPDNKLYCREKYPKQMAFFQAGKKYRQRLFCAGNRTGKSFSGLYELVCHATGQYQEWWVGKKFNRPVNIWIAGMTLKMLKDSVQKELLGARGDFGSGLVPKDLIVRTRTAPGVPDAIETVDIKHATGGFSTVTFKSYESGLEGFVGAAVDVIMFDEEPPLNVYVEGVIRTATTGGIIFVTFTPDRGFNDTLLHFFENGHFQEGEVGGKYVSICTWDDIPHLSDDVKQELWETIPPHLRDAKTKGIPYLGSGKIYPVPEFDFVVTPFSIPEEWPRAYALDPGWNRTAGLWFAYNKQNDTIYIYSEYYVGEQQIAVHANAISQRGKWMVGVIDKASLGSTIDGIKIIKLYNDFGLTLFPSKESKAVESGIQQTLDRLGSNRLKVFSSCVNVLDEYRIYRRDDKGHVVKKRDHLMDCMRYIVDHYSMIMRINPDYDPNADFVDTFSRMGVNECTGY